MSCAARRLTFAAVVVGVLLVGTGRADAHEPVFVTAADPTPPRGPLLVDGNHSWAVYGTLPAQGATRGFRSRLEQGQQLIASLLVPDLEPERSLGPSGWPVLQLGFPDGTTKTFTSRRLAAFDEPFSGTRYVRLVDYRVSAPQSGTYAFSVRAKAPARFTVATGVVEGFGGAKRDVEAQPVGGLGGWYRTAPPTPAPVVTTTMPAVTTHRSTASKGVGWPLLVVVAVALVGGSVAAVFAVRARRERVRHSAQE